MCEARVECGKESDLGASTFISVQSSLGEGVHH